MTLYEKMYRQNKKKKGLVNNIQKRSSFILFKLKTYGKIKKYDITFYQISIYQTLYS